MEFIRFLTLSLTVFSLHTVHAATDRDVTPAQLNAGCVIATHALERAFHRVDPETGKKSFLLSDQNSKALNASGRVLEEAFIQLTNGAPCSFDVASTDKLANQLTLIMGLLQFPWAKAVEVQTVAKHLDSYNNRRNRLSQFRFLDHKGNLRVLMMGAWACFVPSLRTGKLELDKQYRCTWCNSTGTDKGGLAVLDCGHCFDLTCLFQWWTCEFRSQNTDIRQILEKTKDAIRTLGPDYANNPECAKEGGLPNQHTLAKTDKEKAALHDTIRSFQFEIERLAKYTCPACDQPVQKIPACLLSTFMDPKIFWGSAYGCLDVVKRGLHLGADINSQNHMGNTPLHLITRIKARGLIQQLLEKGANPLQKNKRGNTPIHEAAAINACETLCILLEAAGEPNAVNIKGALGATPLHVAVENNCLNAIEYLIETWNANIDAMTTDGKTVLHIAAEKGNIQTLETILRYIENSNATAFLHLKNKAGNTPLLCAAIEGKIANCQLLLKHGANVHDTTADGENLLHLAAQHGSCEAIEELIMHYHFDVNSSIKYKYMNTAAKSSALRGQTPLLIAAHYGKTAAIKTLFKHGADQYAETFNGGMFSATLASEAATRPVRDEKNRPINSLDETDRKDTSNETLLFLARTCGIDLNPPSPTQSYTPFYASLVYCKLETTKTLMALGATPRLPQQTIPKYLLKLQEMSRPLSTAPEAILTFSKEDIDALIQYVNQQLSHLEKILPDARALIPEQINQVFAPEEIMELKEILCRLQKEINGQGPLTHTLFTTMFSSMERNRLDTLLNTLAKLQQWLYENSKLKEILHALRGYNANSINYIAKFKFLIEDCKVDLRAHYSSILEHAASMENFGEMPYILNYIKENHREGKNIIHFDGDWEKDDEIKMHMLEKLLFPANKIYDNNLRFNLVEPLRYCLNELKIDPNMPIFTSYTGATHTSALAFAVRTGNIPATYFLISKGATITPEVEAILKAQQAGTAMLRDKTTTNLLAKIINDAKKLRDR